MRRQHAADAIGDADFVKGFDGIEDVDTIVVKVGHAGGFIEAPRQPLQFGPHPVAQHVGLLNEPAKAELGRELVGSVHSLLQVAVLFQRQQNSEQRGLGKAGRDADFLERQRRLAVEAVENLKRAADGTQVILLVGCRVVGVERPFGNAPPRGLALREEVLSCFSLKGRTFTWRCRIGCLCSLYTVRTVACNNFHFLDLV